MAFHILHTFWLQPVWFQMVEFSSSPQRRPVDSVNVLYVHVGQSMRGLPSLNINLSLRAIWFRLGENGKVITPKMARPDVLDLSVIQCSELAASQLERERNAPRCTIQCRPEHAVDRRVDARE